MRVLPMDVVMLLVAHSVGMVSVGPLSSRAGEFASYRPCLHAPPGSPGHSLSDADLGRDTMSESDAVVAARIEFLVLRASLTEQATARTDHIFILPSLERLTTTRSIEALSRIAKPVVCSATVGEGVMSVSCQPLSQEALALHQMYVSGLERGQGIGRAFAGRTDPDDLILVTSSQESMLVPVRGLRRWFHDYHLVPPLVLEGRESTGAERARGIIRVVTIGRYESIAPEFLPPDIQRWLAEGRGMWPPS